MKRIIKVVVVVLLVLCILRIVGFMLTYDEKHNPSTEADHAYFAAYKFCEKYAPSATKFTTESGEDYLEGKAKWNATDNYWFALGWVDAQNKFGAMRHQHWEAHLNQEGTQWRLTYLTIGDEMFVNHIDK